MIDNYLRLHIFRLSKGIFENFRFSVPRLTFSLISIRKLSANPLISKLKNWREMYNSSLQVRQLAKNQECRLHHNNIKLKQLRICSMETPIEKRPFKGYRSFSPVYAGLYLVFVSLFVLAPTRNVKVVYPSGQEVVETPGRGSQSPPTKEESNRQFVEIDFDNVDILLFVKFVSEATGKNFVVDPEVKGRVTIVSPEKIPVDEVYKVFQSVLEVHGFTTVVAGSMIKIVPSSEAQGKGVETQFLR